MANKIAWTNFSHSSARDTYNIGGKGASPNNYVYISACSFEIRLHVVGALAATAELRVDLSYYDWTLNSGAGGWVSASSVTASARGRDATDNKYFYHNWNGTESSSGTSKFHLWRAHLVTVSSGNQRHLEANFTVGGAGCMSEPQYNSICQGKYIISAGRLGGDFLHDSGGSADDNNAVNIFRWSDNSGTELKEIYANKMIPKYW